MSHHLKLCRNISYPYQHCGVCVCQQNQIAAPDPIENHGRRYRQDREPSEDKRAPAALDFYGWSLEVSTYEGKTGRQDRERCVLHWGTTLYSITTYNYYTSTLEK